MAAIPFQKISVVVQGPVVGSPKGPFESRLTLRCLESIRTYLPEAEIILSTWKGYDVTDLPFDQLIENDDPGALHYLDFRNNANNVNRQIVSTRTGLLAAARPYALKLRSDMLVIGTSFLDYFDRFSERSEWSILESKVLASTLFSRIPGVVWKWPYHPGDWFFFGQTADVLNIWDIPLAPEPETTEWFLTRPRPPNYVGGLHRYTPEQYLWLTFLRKHRTVRCDHQLDMNPETIEGTEKSFASNLILISPRQAGLVFAKYAVSTGFSSWIQNPGTCYTHSHWRHLYDKHCRHSPFSIYALSLLRSRFVNTTGKTLKWMGTVRTGIARWRGRVK